MSKCDKDERNEVNQTPSLKKLFCITAVVQNSDYVKIPVKCVVEVTKGSIWI